MALVVDPAVEARQIVGDDRAVERLLSRLTAALVAAGGPGERIGIATSADDDAVAIRFDRPVALRVADDDATLLSLDGEGDAVGAPLLGMGFALRLARNLATQLGGALAIDAEWLDIAVADRRTSHRGAGIDQLT